MIPAIGTRRERVRIVHTGDDESFTSDVNTHSFGEVSRVEGSRCDDVAGLGFAHSIALAMGN